MCRKKGVCGGSVNKPKKIKENSMNINKEEVYVRDAEYCALCGKMMCFENVYYWRFNNGGFFVCADCNKNKDLIVLEKTENFRG